MATSFEDLTRALAGNVSRRTAVKIMGGAVAGSVLAALRLDRAEAAPSDCSAFCGKTANTSGPAHAQCLQACKQCGGNPAKVCVGPGIGGPGTFACCSSGTLCNPATGTCAPPLTCTSHGCNATCVSSTGGVCGCVGTTEGTTACVQTTCTFVPCTTSADCGPNFVCFTENCCGTANYCIPLCA